MDIRLRKIHESDLEMIMNWRMREDITKYMNTDPVLTLEGQKKWLSQINQDVTSKYWIIEVEQVSAGILQLVNLDDTNKRCNWGYYIAEKKLRSLKLAMAIEWNLYDYVFDHLGYNKMLGEVLAFNKEVVTIHKMCGSDVAGTLKEHIYKNGHFYDVVLVEITKDKWEKIKMKYQYPVITFED